MDEEIFVKNQDHFEKMITQPCVVICFLFRIFEQLITAGQSIGCVWGILQEYS